MKTGAREFWINDFKFGPDESVSQEVIVDTIPNCGFGDEDKLRVIEYSAYRELKKQLEQYEKHLKIFEESIRNSFKMREDRLKAQLEKCKEQRDRLTREAFYFAEFEPKDANKELEEIK